MSNAATKRYGYHVWANEKLIKHLQELPAEICHQEVQSVFPTIYDGLVHLYVVDNVWLGAMSGVSFEEIRNASVEVMERTKGKSLEELLNLYLDLSKQFEEFFQSQSNLQAIQSYHHPQFGTLHASHMDIIEHIVNHGTYHRGNIAAMLRQLGHAATPTDYVYYLYLINQ